MSYQEFKRVDVRTSECFAHLYPYPNGRIVFSVRAVDILRRLDMLAKRVTVMWDKEKRRIAFKLTDGTGYLLTDNSPRGVQMRVSAFMRHIELAAPCRATVSVEGELLVLQLPPI